MTIDIPSWRLRNPEINDPEDLPGSREWQELSKKLGNPAVRTDKLYVGFGIANGALMMGQLLSGHQLLPNVKRSNILSWEDLSNGNLVFIGSGKTSKIIRSILERGDFGWDSSKEGSTKIINLRPLPGERAYFDQTIDPVTEDYREQYGLISMMPGLNEDLQVLVLGGGTSEGDWAVSQYVTEPNHVRELVGYLKDKSGNLPKGHCKDQIWIAGTHFHYIRHTPRALNSIGPAARISAALKPDLPGEASVRTEIGSSFCS
jgi:hypothetical protein